MVSELEERHAARFGGYDWRAWQALDREERITNVACYRLDHLVEMHSNDVIQRAVKRRAAAARPPRRS